MMNKALVISGGGARGAFAVGVIEGLAAKGRSWDAFYGTSTGAIVAAMMAQDQLDELIRLWLGLRGNKDVYRKTWFGGYVRRYLRGGLYSPKPLKQLLDRYLSWDRVVKPLSAFSVNLQSGDLGVANRTYPLADGVLASCSYPPAFPPVTIGLAQHVDGGVREMIPLAAAIADGADEITVIALSPVDVPDARKRFRTLGSVIKRALTIVGSETRANDLELQTSIIGYINQLVAAGLALTKRHIELTIYEPTEDLGETLDFSPGLNRARYLHGIERTQ